MKTFFSIDCFRDDQISGSSFVFKNIKAKGAGEIILAKKNRTPNSTHKKASPRAF